MEGLLSTGPTQSSSFDFLHILVSKRQGNDEKGYHIAPKGHIKRQSRFAGVISGPSKPG